MDRFSDLNFIFHTLFCLTDTTLAHPTMSDNESSLLKKKERKNLCCLGLLDIGLLRNLKCHKCKSLAYNVDYRKRSLFSYSQFTIAYKKKRTIVSEYVVRHVSIMLKLYSSFECWNILLGSFECLNSCFFFNFSEDIHIGYGGVGRARLVLI